MGLFSRYTVLICALLAVPYTGYCRSQGKELKAGEAGGRIVIDGKLDEPAWANAEKATGFTQYTPKPNEPSLQRTEVSILYDNDAIYVGAILYDEPGRVLKQLSPRDEYGDYSTDAFGATFDTYNDHQNATEFVVTAAGVQADAIMKFNSVNFSWNAAWFSKVSILEKGWSVEMRIPYSALRFSDGATQVWGVNFFRVTRRYRETSYWSTVLPTVSNTIDQAGTLTGIHDIKAPVRLVLLPYISAYAENYAGANTQTLNGGLDVKYGLNESFTLDMTLVPDFGQTIYDNRVLNLSPIEVRYNENRYFFTEGLDLFNKNDLFYSRRVGGTPVNINSPYNHIDTGAEEITKNPATAKLYNATKISGRTKTNLGIGFFNAVAAPAYATIHNNLNGTTRKYKTAPLTNYNVLVLDQALQNNSYISFINTNVYRKDSSYNADVSALLFKFANRSNTYAVSGSADVSQLFYPDMTDVGRRYNLNIGKISGNYYWSVSTKSVSDRFNPNDLGYLDQNNITWYGCDQYYNLFKPVGNLVEAYNHVGAYYYRIFNPDAFQRVEIFGSHNVTFKNYTTVGAYWTLQPFNNYDYLEPRTPGRYYLYPKNYMAGGFYSTDYRRKFAIDLQLTNRWFSERKRNSFSWSISPRYRFNDKVSAIYSLSGQNAIDDAGYVDKVNGITSGTTSGVAVTASPTEIVFGIRDVHTITNSLSAAYVFNNKMSLKLNARHYWSQAQYSQYAFLDEEGGLVPANTYHEDRNINFNTFNIFMGLVWQFRPGSEMTFVYQNSLFSSPDGPEMVKNYFDDLDQTFRSPQSNSLSLKIIYYLDYLNVQRAFSRKS